MATENRVSGNHLPDEKPMCSLMEWKMKNVVQTNGNVNSNMTTILTCVKSHYPRISLLALLRSFTLPHTTSIFSCYEAKDRDGKLCTQQYIGVIKWLNRKK